MAVDNSVDQSANNYLKAPFYKAFRAAAQKTSKLKKVINQ
jgi:hypothetical protein